MLAAARGTVYARDAQDGADAGYGLETEMAELDGALVEAAQTAAEALDNLLRPLTRLGKRLEAVLEDAPDWLDGAARARIEGALGSLGWRCDLVAGWLSLLSRVGGPAGPDFFCLLAKSAERRVGNECVSAFRYRWSRFH